MGAGAFVSADVGSGRLTGRRVLVTRPRERAASLVAALAAEGADVVLLPTIEVVPPEDPGPLELAASRLEAWDWVVFTSVHGVRALHDAGGGEGTSTAGPGPQRPRCACVGEATAAAARAAGWMPDVVAAAPSARGLVAALEDRADLRGARVLFPRAADARAELASGLRAAGAKVDEVVAYRKDVPREAAREAGALLRKGGVDAMTFTSPSTVRNFIRLCGGEAGEARVVVIGETTGAAAEAAGLRVSAVAAYPTSAGLVDAVIRAFNG